MKRSLFVVLIVALAAVAGTAQPSSGEMPSGSLSRDFSLPSDATLSFPYTSDTIEWNNFLVVPRDREWIENYVRNYWDNPTRVEPAYYVDNLLTVNTERALNRLAYSEDLREIYSSAARTLWSGQYGNFEGGTFGEDSISAFHDAGLSQGAALLATSILTAYVEVTASLDEESFDAAVDAGFESFMDRLETEEDLSTKALIDAFNEALENSDVPALVIKWIGRSAVKAFEKFFCGGDEIGYCASKLRHGHDHDDHVETDPHDPKHSHSHEAEKHAHFHLHR